jgi:hypothetical protein
MRSRPLAECPCSWCVGAGACCSLIMDFFVQACFRVFMVNYVQACFPYFA